MPKIYLKYGDAIYRAVKNGDTCPRGGCLQRYMSIAFLCSKTKCKQPLIMSETSLTRRIYPAKPVKQIPVNITKEAAKETSLLILREFYMEARREIKARETTTLQHRKDEIHNSVSFICDSFSLTINFKGGITV